MTVEITPKKRTSRWAVAGYLASTAIYLVLLGDLVARALRKVAAGQGLETYRTYWEVEFNYIGVLVLFGCIPLALLVGALFRLREFLEWRSLERNYRARK